MKRVYILLGGLWGPDGAINSRGMLGLADELRQGFEKSFVETYYWSDYESVITDIKRHPGDKIILIGYSGGGSRATWVANRIFQTIDLVITYDPSPNWQMIDLPRTVNKAINYYNTTPLMFGLGGGKLVGRQVETFTISQQHLLVQYNKELHKRTISEIVKL